MKIEQKITEPSNYGDKRDLKDIQYIVIQEFSEKPTCHYHVLDNKVYHIIPDDYTSCSVDGPKFCYLGIYHGVCTRYNSITICIKADPEKEDLDLLSHVIMMLKRRYKVDMNKIIRQSEVTGEPNPQKFLDNKLWNDSVIQRVQNML